MLQCDDCEHCQRDAAGAIQLNCNPLTNIKEPSCLQKWNLFRLDAVNHRLEVLTGRVETMVQAYQSTLSIYRRLAPMQEKMFRHMEREIDDIEDSEKWKHNGGDEFEDDDEDDDSAKDW